MDEKTSVSIAALDSALTHLQEANKRLARLFTLSLVVNILLFGAVLYFLMNYEIISQDVKIDSKDGTANYNYIGNDGDIDNGSD